MILFKTDITKGLDIVSSQFGISNKNCGILFTHIRLIEFSTKKKNKGAEAPLNYFLKCLFSISIDVIPAGRLWSETYLLSYQRSFESIP